MSREHERNGRSPVEAAAGYPAASRSVRRVIETGISRWRIVVRRLGESADRRDALTMALVRRDPCH
jgi:hypothetical protein